MQCQREDLRDLYSSFDVGLAKSGGAMEIIKTPKVRAESVTFSRPVVLGMLFSLSTVFNKSVSSLSL